MEMFAGALLMFHLHISTYRRFVTSLSKAVGHSWNHGYAELQTQTHTHARTHALT